MKRYLAAALFLIFNIAVIAQASFGLKVNGGVSKMSDNLYDHYHGSQTSYFVPSGQAGFFYDQPVRAHEVFGVELLFSQIQGKTKSVDTIGTYSANGTTSTNILLTNTFTGSISYLTLPVYYGVKIKKFTIKAGLQVSVMLARQGKEHYQVNYIPPYSYYTVPMDKSGKLYVKDGAFGQTASITYNISQKFAIEASYYYELSNLYRNAKLNASAENVWRFQQITLGLRYSFLTIQKKQAK
jgi:opacity protein-like surface antigen